MLLRSLVQEVHAGERGAETYNRRDVRTAGSEEENGMRAQLWWWSIGVCVVSGVLGPLSPTWA